MGHPAMEIAFVEFATLEAYVQPGTFAADNHVKLHYYPYLPKQWCLLAESSVMSAQMQSFWQIQETRFRSVNVFLNFIYLPDAANCPDGTSSIANCTNGVCTTGYTCTYGYLCCKQAGKFPPYQDTQKKCCI